MKAPDEHKDDLIKDWISPPLIDKAPEGITDKIMAQLQVEPAYTGNSNSPVPVSFKVGAILAFLGLILIASMLPSISNEAWAANILNSVKTTFDWKIQLPDMDGLSPFMNYIIYFAAGILIFILVDRVISKAFPMKIAGSRGQGAGS